VPRYYFHLYNDIVALDEEGTDLADFESVWRQAELAAQEIACESIKKGHLNLDHRIEVADEHGEIVLKLKFRDVFTITG
jgi:hypothetical protein